MLRQLTNRLFPGASLTTEQVRALEQRQEEISAQFIELAATVTQHVENRKVHDR